MPRCVGTVDVLALLISRRVRVNARGLLVHVHLVYDTLLVAVLLDLMERSCKGVEESNDNQLTQPQRRS